jgi:hypothetical protein
MKYEIVLYEYLWSIDEDKMSFEIVLTVKYEGKVKDNMTPQSKTIQS